MGDFEFDLTEFRKAVDLASTHSRRSVPEIINRAARYTLMGGKGGPGAIRSTPRADPKKIRATLGKPANNGHGRGDTLALRIVMAAAKRNGQILTREEISQRVKRLISRRASAAGYTAGPGWTPAAKAFGANGRKTNSRFARSAAVHGYGKRATVNQLLAELANYAPAADRIGREALQSALDAQAADMIDYWTRRQQAIFDKISP